MGDAVGGAGLVGVAQAGGAQGLRLHDVRGALVNLLTENAALAFKVRPFDASGQSVTATSSAFDSLLSSTMAASV
jgi:hypothetical protein